MSLTSPEEIRSLQRNLYAKAKKEPDFRFYSLYPGNAYLAAANVALLETDRADSLERNSFPPQVSNR